MLVTTNKIVQASGGVYGSSCGEVGSGSDCWGELEDANTHDGMGWSKEGRKSFKTIMPFLPNLLKKNIYIYRYIDLK